MGADGGNSGGIAALQVTARGVRADTHGTRWPTSRLHVDRTPGSDRHHRDFGGNALAGAGQGQGQRQTDGLSVEYAADWDGDDDVRERLQRFSALRICLYLAGPDLSVLVAGRVPSLH